MGREDHVASPRSHPIEGDSHTARRNCRWQFDEPSDRPTGDAEGGPALGGKQIAPEPGGGHCDVSLRALPATPWKCGEREGGPVWGDSGDVERAFLGGEPRRGRDRPPYRAVAGGEDEGGWCWSFEHGKSD